MKAPREPRAASRSATSAAQAALVARAPVKHQVALRKSFAGGLSPRQAIRVKCLDCCGYERAEVAECRVVTCPLWAIRPYRYAVTTEAEAAA